MLNPYLGETTSSGWDLPIFNQPTPEELRRAKLRKMVLAGMTQGAETGMSGGQSGLPGIRSGLLSGGGAPAVAAGALPSGAIPPGGVTTVNPTLQTPLSITGQSAPPLTVPQPDVGTHSNWRPELMKQIAEESIAARQLAAGNVPTQAGLGGTIKRMVGGNEAGTYIGRPQTYEQRAATGQWTPPEGLQAERMAAGSRATALAESNADTAQADLRSQVLQATGHEIATNPMASTAMAYGTLGIPQPPRTFKQMTPEEQVASLSAQRDAETDPAVQQILTDKIAQIHGAGEPGSNDLITRGYRWMTGSSRYGPNANVPAPSTLTPAAWALGGPVGLLAGSLISGRGQPQVAPQGASQSPLSSTSAANRVAPSGNATYPNPNPTLYPDAHWDAAQGRWMVIRNGRLIGSD